MMYASDMQNSKLLIAEEQNIYGTMYKSLFRPVKALELLDSSGYRNLDVLLKTAARFNPDVILIGRKVFNQDSILELGRIRAGLPRVGIVCLATSFEPEIKTTLPDLVSKSRSGMAIFLKSSLDEPDQLINLVGMVKNGHFILDPNMSQAIFAEEPDYLQGLTAREVEILRLVSLGYANTAIARSLYVEPATIHNHIYHIYKKLKIHIDSEQLDPRVGAARLFLEANGSLVPGR